MGSSDTGQLYCLDVGRQRLRAAVSVFGSFADRCDETPNCIGGNQNSGGASRMKLAPDAATVRAIVPATAKASSVPPCVVSHPASMPPSGAPPIKAKK